MSLSGSPEYCGPAPAPAPAGGMPTDEAWLQVRLKLRPDLIVEQREQAGRIVFLIGDPVRNKFFQVGELEKQVIGAFDGTATVAEIAQANFYDEAGRSASVQAIQIAKWLVQHHLGTIIGADNSKRVQERARILHKASRFGLLNLISFRIPLFNPTRLLNRLQPVAKWLFNPATFAVWLCLMVTAVVLVWQRQADFSLQFAGVLSGNGWIWMLVIWSGLKVVHELGHGLACRRYGGSVPEAGLLLLLFSPLAYVNVTSSWKFPSRWQRMAVAVAGMYIELFVAAFAAIAWTQFEEDSVWKDLCLHAFTMAGVTTVLFNANALMKFDGYYLLSDLLEIPNLYGKGQGWLWDRVRVLCLGWNPVQNRLTGPDRWIVPIYAILSAIWRLTVSFGLLVGAGVLFHGAGLLIAGVAIFSWYLAPAVKQFHSIRALNQQQPINRFRLATSGLSFALLLLGMFFVFSSPASKSAPAIARFENESILRASSDGFVKAIHVADGQQVTEGTLLLELENRQLETEVTVLETELDECQIQQRKALQAKELARYQSEQERARSIEEKLIEKRKQLAELRVFAPFEGVVLQRNLDFMSGCFLKQGEPLLTIAESSSLEIILSVEQDDFSGMQEGRRACYKAVFPGAPVTTCQIKLANPSASTVPVHEALCANYGGPLAVKPAPKTRGQESNSNQLELLTPRFNVELLASAELRDKLKAGQRGLVVFPVEQRSLGVHWYLSACRWIEKKIETAVQNSSN